MEKLVSDLSGVRVGDYIWHIQDGWEKVIKVNDSDSDYPICTTFTIYTIDGKVFKSDLNPVVFVDPPKFFNVEPKPKPKPKPKPCEFKNNELVWVSEDGEDWCVVFFKEMIYSDYPYVCYYNGMPKEGTNETSNWLYCRKYEDNPYVDDK